MPVLPHGSQSPAGRGQRDPEAKKRELGPLPGGTLCDSRHRGFVTYRPRFHACRWEKNRPKRSEGPHFAFHGGAAVAIHKVLIVDDARPDLMNLEKIVSGAGYKTLTATNGQEAV